MDSLEGVRSQKYDAIDSAIRYGQQIQNSGDKNQGDLFSNDAGENNLIKTPELKIIDDWDEKSSLKFEKEVLGTYVSGHPLLEHSEELEDFTSIDFSDKIHLKKNMIEEIALWHFLKWIVLGGMQRLLLFLTVLVNMKILLLKILLCL